MTYTTFDRTPAPGRTMAQTVLILAVGVLFGVMLAQLHLEGNVQEAVSAPPIAGENWHGNVRHSTP
ncbi:hypothetical protein [uncultured Roseobacter sp.]|uniref:hypothetical protein n=1 Tax=uncultured Roseobacter sp. TaxID=114847 RepID=UPI0026236011|nr:hypothetical protein [uncultured Roseobacter sp.]